MCLYISKNKFQSEKTLSIVIAYDYIFTMVLCWLRFYHGSSGGGMGWGSLVDEVVEQLKFDTHDMTLFKRWNYKVWIINMNIAYKVTEVVVDSTPVIFVSDSVMIVLIPAWVIQGGL